MKRTAMIPAVLLATLVLGGCHVPDVARKTVTIEQEWPAAEIDTVDLRGHNGSVKIVAGTDDKINLEARVRSRHDNAEERIRKFVNPEIEDGTLYIGERKSGRRRVVILPFFRAEDSAIAYVLTVPSRMNLQVTNVNGSMKIEGVSGTSALRSVNGSIEVSTPGGQVTAKTVNGRVRADFMDEFRGAKLGTVNGSITVSLPPNASFRTDISQVNGSFKSNVPMTVRSTSPIEGESEDLPSGPAQAKYPLELTTVNGSVTVNQGG